MLVLLLLFVLGKSSEIMQEKKHIEHCELFMLSYDDITYLVCKMGDTRAHPL